MCNNHEQDFLLASEQHPSTSYTTYMGKASVVSVSENESAAKEFLEMVELTALAIVPSMDVLEFLQRQQQLQVDVLVTDVTGR